MMLRSLKDLEQYAVMAADGEIGRVVNFLLDDKRWVIRYLVANTGGGHRVLVSPAAFRDVDWATRRFHLAQSKDTVAHCPSADADPPVALEHARDHLHYYGFVPYWGYSAVWGMGSHPSARLFEPGSATELPGRPVGDRHLRSAEELRGYHIQATDQVVGHIEDLVVDDTTWTVRYLVIDTSNWWFGREVLVAPSWARTISYDDRKISVEMSRQRIEDSPAWDASAAVNRAYEAPQL